MDTPITRPEDDRLGRLKVAESFADHILTLDPSQGLVVGVLGPWGSGKTSFINLLCRRLEERGVTILEFNPWMFSGANQLVQAFFIEISAQLRLRLNLEEIGKLLEEYGEIFSGLSWIPIIGSGIEHARAVNKIIAKLLQARKEGAHGRQYRVRDALAKLDKPIAVVLDDIDRLTTAEIREIFKLVRLTASFPNVVYILAFDRAPVEQALTEQGISGRDYLEKIVQIAIDLPQAPVHLLSSYALDAIAGALGTLGNGNIESLGPFDRELWPEVFLEIIRPLIRNIRDVRRYVATFSGTVCSLDGQVALVDVLALEAIRVFLPDVFTRICLSVESLAVASYTSQFRRPTAELSDEEKVRAVLAAAGEKQAVVSNLIRLLFPGQRPGMKPDPFLLDTNWPGRWLRERRVAHAHVLRFYLERVVGPGLQAFFQAEKAWALMKDCVGLEQYLRSLPIEQVPEVVSSLLVYSEDFSPEQVVPATIALLNMLPDIPDRRRSVFDIEGKQRVRSVILRLLRTLQNPEAVKVAVHQIMSELRLLSLQLELLQIATYKAGTDEGLITEVTAAEFAQMLRTSVYAAHPDTLLQETSLLRVLLWTKRTRKPDEPEILIPDEPAVTRAVLKSARYESLSQSGNRDVRREPRLAWDQLIELYGDESVLRERIEALRASSVGELLEIELAERYLAGWRPTEFDD